MGAKEEECRATANTCSRSSWLASKGNNLLDSKRAEVRIGPAVNKALSHSAFHECGHVVAARVLGIAVESVTIIPDENYERGEVFAAALTVLVEPLKLHDNASVETAALIL